MGNAKLFVNGTNAETLYDEDEKLPVRVLHLGDIEDPDAEYHDILISNMGDQPLTGLYVRLEGAQNVQIDPYWTITENGTRTLGAFSTTSANKSYGELPNFARIRLLPEYDENGEIISGIVSGYLVIGGDGVDEVKIKLTGSAGKPKIVTEEILDGVKYVPYASLIQTNNTGDTDAVRFELENVSGDTGLPNGVEMYPDGELYGVPLVDGEFTFHVKLIASKNSSILDEAAFTMKVILNTDDNVWGASDGGYSVLDYIGELAAPGGGILDGTQHYLLPDYIEQVFRSEGEYEYFIDFYLDGQKLASGVDYTSQAGSTVITIFEQTLTNAGSGTHTIAAEFHEKETSDGTPDGSLKRTAQNYTINVEPKVPTPSTSQPTTPSTPAPTATPDTTPTAKPSTTPAVPTASPEGTPPVNTPEPVGTPKPGAGTDTNTPSSGAGNQQAPSVVDCQVFLVDGGGNALVNYALELHSTPMTAVTNEAGMASFSRVAFGAHTIFALGTTGKPVASKSFTFVSGYSVALNGDIITVRPGGTVKLTMRLDGNTLELVSADTAIPKTGDDSPIEVYLVTACVAATALGTLLVYMRKKRSNI